MIDSLSSPLYAMALHGGTMEIWTCDPAGQKEREDFLRGLSETAGNILSKGAKATDVVQYVVTVLEDHDGFNAGKGGALNEEGGHELEAAIVDGATGEYGAVTCARYTKNPINGARAVLNSKSVCLLAGEAADGCAKRAGLEMVENTYFTTPKRLEHLQAWKAGQLAEAENLGTMGAIARDIHGNLAAAGSTGGNTCKPIGIIGAGLIADSDIAVVCSGHGESILKSSVAATVASLVSARMPLEEAVRNTLPKVSRQSDGMPCAILAIDNRGKVHSQSTGRIFSTATSSSYASPHASMSQTTIGILDQHEFYTDGLIRAGLTRYPTVDGQVVIEVQNGGTVSDSDFFTLETIFKGVSNTVSMLQQVLGSSTFGLITDGGTMMTLVPRGPAVTNGQSKFPAAEQPRHALNPTRVIDFEPTKLDKLCAILVDSPLSNGHVRRPLHDSKAEAVQYPRTIWSDEFYTASLLPSGTTFGECILRSRAVVNNDVSFREDTRLRAIHDVMQLLKSRLDIARCGICIDNLEAGKGVVTLSPQLRSKPLTSPVIPSHANFTRTCPEYLATALGPLSKEKEKLLALTAKLRSSTILPQLASIRSWENSSSHAFKALRDPWYEAMFELQNTFYHACVDFFRSSLGYYYALSPITSDCISSPMGLGSDSLPVEVPLFGRDTYLADSMQFTLEYILRVRQGTRGIYYVSPSFRGEDPDESHLNQFYHVECELQGGMDDGMEVMEKFVVFVADAMLKKHGPLIRSIAGDTNHISSLVNFAKPPGARFPKVTLEEALVICGDDADTWEFAVSEAPEKGKKLTRRGERVLIEKYGGAVWLTMMDHLSVPFYQAYAGQDRLKARCGDLLMGIGEMGGLGERHMTAAQVEEALLQHQVPLETYQWYMDIRNFREVPSVGWGMGMERFMLWLLKHNDVRDIAIIPRLKMGKYLP